MTKEAPSRTNQLLLALWVVEGSALVAALALYKKADHPLPEFLASPAGEALVASAFALAASALWWVFVARRDRTQIAPSLALNLASVALAAGAAELAIRLLSVETPDGTTFANTRLLPRSWEATAAHNRSTLARAAAEGSFLIADPELGWTIAPNRKSGDYNLEFARRVLAQRRADCAGGAPIAPRPPEETRDREIYQSSAEGLRSARAGIALASETARRIALVGDSFTFGLEVPFENTWGYELERILGDGTQVLNFGVDGYGVDQAVLRYRRDVVAWHPDLVILGMIHDDFRRALCVYGFLCFPGSEIPFAKPRFVSDVEKPVNTPLPAPDAIFSHRSITELPFVELDAGFGQRGDWEERFYHRSYAIRFLLSRFPRFPEPSPALSDEAMRSLVAGLVGSFLRDAHAHGSRALVVFFPSHVPICGPESSFTSHIAQEAFAPAGIPFVDLTQCVDAVAPEERFVALHYSAATNAAIARCLADEIRSG
jgi:GDSL-like Lipase/Acylhydrolase